MPLLNQTRSLPATHRLLRCITPPVQWDGPWGPAKGSRSSKSNHVHLVRAAHYCQPESHVGHVWAGPAS